MNEIIKKTAVTEDITRFDIYNPGIANKARAGQFVVIRAFINGERIPLTISGSDISSGTITLLFFKAGKTTFKLAEMKEGEKILDVAGPLGKESEIEYFGRVVVAGGGIGIAPILPIVKALKAKNNYVVTVLGVKTSSSLIMFEELKEASDEIHICTDDGSRGYKGFISCFLSDYLASTGKTPAARVIAVGPALMMKAVCEVTRPLAIPTIVSLNPIMIDGTGMCGSCRVEIGKETRFACVDGPEFDGHLVNFESLLNRLGFYVNEEKESLNIFLKKSTGCQEGCKLKDID